jgi:arylsulfatase A-like enzyme
VSCRRPGSALIRRAERAAPLLAPAIVAALVGCGAKVEAPESIVRWIDEPAREQMTIDDLSAFECVELIDFSDDRASAQAPLVEGRRLDGVGSGAALVGGETPPRLEIARPFQPGEVEQVRVEASGLRRGRMLLRWSDGTTTRELVLGKTAGAGERRDQFVFDLAASGVIAAGTVRYELLPTSVAGEIVDLRSVCLGRSRPSAELRAAAASQPRRIVIDDDVRDVLVVPPDGVVRRTVRPPRGAKLEFGLGHLGHRAASRLRVVARERGREAAVLVDRDFAAESALGWIDQSVDLDAFSGREIELEIAVELQPATAGAASIPVLSNPTFVVPGRRTRPSILVVSLDTLRADHLELYGYRRETAPRLTAWARRRATVFERVVAPSGWTLPSHFSLFTGLDAIRHPANYNSIALDESAYAFLAERLRSAGYQTFAITGGGFVHPDYGLARGFESFRYWGDKGTRELEIDRHLARAEELLERTADRPILLFFHTYEIHAPNTIRPPFPPAPPARLAGAQIESVNDPPTADGGFLGTHHLVVKRDGESSRRLGEADLALAGDAYDSAIRFADERVGRLLDRFDALPDGRESIVAVLSDHGEFLGEYGRGGHAGIASENLFVPLIVAGPGPRRAERIASQVRLIDLHATLLEWAGMTPDVGADSRSLAGLLVGRSEPPRVATAYAASTNFGLARYLVDGRKLEWRNSPWRPIRDQMVWLRTEGLQERPLEDLPTDEEALRARREMVREYVTTAPGLRLAFSNHAAVPARIMLWSDLVDPVALKVGAVGDPALEWADIQHLELDLRGGESVRLIAERVVQSRLGMRLELANASCGATTSETIAREVSALRGGLVLRFAVPPCRSGSRGFVELRLKWIGPDPARQRQASEDLVEDLRALGYL